MGNPIDGWRAIKSMRRERAWSGWGSSQARAENSQGNEENPRQQIRGKMLMIFVGFSIYWKYDGNVDLRDLASRMEETRQAYRRDLASRMEETRQAYNDFDWGLASRMEETRQAYTDFRRELTNDWSDLKSRMTNNIDWSQYTSSMDLREYWNQQTMDLSRFTSRMDLSELADNARLKELRAKYFNGGATWSLPSAVNNALPDWAKVAAGWALIDLVMLFILLSIWEATKFPRQASIETKVDKVRMAAQLFGDLLLAPYFALRPGEVPELRYQKTEKNESIIKHCPTLQSFKQMAWLRNAWLSFGAIMCFDIAGAKKNLVKRELLRTPDGGNIALDWWAEGPEASVGKKVLIIGSTFVGDALVTVTRDCCRHFTRHGWRCVVMVKRGCGLTMPNVQQVSDNGRPPEPWCFQGFGDMKLAIDHVSQKCGDLPICGLGFSTGAGQIRNYVNATGPKCKLKAAVIVDAAPSWEEALFSAERRVPFVGKGLAVAAEMSYEAGGQQTKGVRLGQKADPRVNPGGLLEFVRDQMGPLHGFEASMSGMHEYLQSCAPANPEGCAVPTLELTTFNDMLIDVPMVPITQDFHLASPNIITCATRGGTHMVRWEGLRLRCWNCMVGLEFLEAALETTSASIAEPLSQPTEEADVEPDAVSTEDLVPAVDVS